MSRTTLTCLITFTTLLLSACGGGLSGDNGDDPFGTGVDSVDALPTISTEVLDAQCNLAISTVTLGENLCIQVTLSDSDSPIDDELISFQTTLGSLDVSDSLTDGNGVAQVLLFSVDATLGAGQVSITYEQTSSQTTLTDSANFEFIAATETMVAAPSLDLVLVDATGDASNRVTSGENLVINAQLFDGLGEPIVDEIVSFQTSIGILSPNSALTNQEGVASTVLNSENELGAGTITATVSSQSILLSADQNIEILAEDAVENQGVRIGSFNDGVFIEGILGTDGFTSEQDIIISAGGTLGFNVALVDENNQLVQANIPVNFSSVCAQSGDASVDSLSVLVNGIARATYQDQSCAGTAGNDDIVTASVSLDGITLFATRVVSLESESAGSIVFIDATPSEIVLLSTGGQNTSTTSTVTFQVNSALGNPLAQQTVNFALNSEIGNLSLSPEQALTNSQGQVSTIVTAGNVPTAVRVTAQVMGDNGNTIQTQSDLLSVNTGLPDQDSFSLALSDPNPEAFNIQGQTVQVVARLADNFNNPVPDGTAISFTAEGGSIQPSCTTISGTCSVEWTSGQPQVIQDHRVTVLATAVGHETLVDSNGDNQYSEQDGNPLNIDNGSGLEVVIANSTGFVDLPEAWIDNNENGVRDDTEFFFDFNNSGTYDQANGLFDGPQCISGCGANSINVRRAVVLVTSSSAALLAVSSDGVELNNNSAPIFQPVASLARGESLNLVLTFTDTVGQPIASGSSIDVATNAGALAGTTSAIMPQTNNPTPRSIAFSLTNDLSVDDNGIDARITMNVVSPSGVVSTLDVIITLL